MKIWGKDAPRIMLKGVRTVAHQGDITETALPASEP